MKKSRLFLLGIFLLFIFSGCSHHRYDLSQYGARVAFATELPKAICRPVGEVTASIEDSGDELELMIHNVRVMARNRTAHRGGNVFILEQDHSARSGKKTVLALGGTAYRCESKKRISKTKNPLPHVTQKAEVELLEPVVKKDKMVATPEFKSEEFSIDDISESDLEIIPE